MRCPGCDYPLWNLTARICPECGRPFAPSDFEFIANSVRFCCPHCNQDYYGTGPRGHLEPIEFDCAKCHHHIHMDQMVLLPTEGVKEEQTEVDTVPWLNRAKLGRFKAWMATVWRAMFEPGRLARATPEGSSVGEAWGFAFLSNIGYLLFGAGPILLFPLAAIPATRGGAGFFLFGLLFVVLIGVGFIAALFPLWGLVAHAILRMTGPTNLGPGASVRTLCYASGANACAAIPCAGMYLSLPGALWTGISAAIMLRVVHGVGWFRAFLAALFLPAAVLLLLVGWIFLIVIPGISTAVVNARTTMQQMSGTRLSTALTAYRARHSNQFPPHAIALMQEGDLVGSDFMMLTYGAVARYSGQPEAAADPSDQLLASFQMMSADQQAKAADSLIASMPKNVIAHRLGDVVFTYHGIDPGTADPALWIAVEIPANPSAGQIIAIVRLDGTSIQIPLAGLAAKLAKQNELRATLALPPLPDPATVRAGTPATSP